MKKATKAIMKFHSEHQLLFISSDFTITYTASWNMLEKVYNADQWTFT